MNQAPTDRLVAAAARCSRLAPVLWLVTVLCSILPMATPSQLLGAATAQVSCGPETVLTPLGFDSRAATVWFALRTPESEPDSAEVSRRWIVEWRPGSPQASSILETDADGRFAPSSGPGPLFALQPCGDQCLQAMAFDGSTWQPLGPAIDYPAGGNAHTTYDAAGMPWIVVHSQTESAVFLDAQAYRFDGERWQSRGRLPVMAAGHPGAGPAPWQEDAIVSGSGQFSATSEPRPWLAGLPAADGRGQVVAMSRRSAAYVTADSRIFRTVDGGATWSRSTWTPWRRGTAEPWQRGVDFDVDLPSGFDSGSLQLAWFDRRRPDAPVVVLSEMTPEGRWRTIDTLSETVGIDGGGELPLSHVLGPATGPWSLIYGCVQSEGKPALVLRSPGRNDGRADLIPIIGR